MQNAIIILILVIILIPAVMTSVKHLKGEGDCCGGPKEKVPKKKIKGTVLYRYNVVIDGMHCTNCKNRVEKNLNLIEPVVSKVDLEKKTAVVSCYGEVDADTIRKVIEDLDFTVVSIEKV